MRHLRQIVSYICIQLFGGTMCITKMFMLICSNLYFVIFKSDTSMSPYFRRVTREEKESDVQWSSLDPSAPGPSQIMSGKSQKSSEGNLPPREENVRMKTVKTELYSSTLYTLAVQTNANLIEQNVRWSLFQISICVRVLKKWQWLRVKAWPGKSQLFTNVFIKHMKRHLRKTVNLLVFILYSFKLKLITFYV